MSQDDKQRELLAEALEALEPFANFPAYEDRRLVVETAAGTRLMGSDLRRARAAADKIRDAMGGGNE